MTGLFGKKETQTISKEREHIAAEKEKWKAMTDDELLEHLQTVGPDSHQCIYNTYFIVRVLQALARQVQKNG